MRTVLKESECWRSPPPRALTVITLTPVPGKPSPLHSPVPKLLLMCGACLPVTSSPGRLPLPQKRHSDICSPGRNELSGWDRHLRQEMGHSVITWDT